MDENKLFLENKHRREGEFEMEDDAKIVGFEVISRRDGHEMRWMR